jgi:hypothetical protein
LGCLSLTAASKQAHELCRVLNKSSTPPSKPPKLSNKGFFLPSFVPSLLAGTNSRRRSVFLDAHDSWTWNIRIQIHAKTPCLPLALGLLVPVELPPTVSHVRSHKTPCTRPFAFLRASDFRRSQNSTNQSLILSLSLCALTRCLQKTIFFSLDKFPAVISSRLMGNAETHILREEPTKGKHHYYSAAQIKMSRKSDLSLYLDLLSYRPLCLLVKCLRRIRLRGVFDQLGI